MLDGRGHRKSGSGHHHLKWGNQDYNQVIVLRNEDGAWKVRIVMFNAGVAGQS